MFIKRLIPEPCCSAPADQFSLCPTGNWQSRPRCRSTVAWKDTRGARHTVQSALPYLKIAKHIALVEIAEEVLETVAHEQLDYAQVSDME